jgi:hypothetical protein
VNEHRIPSWAFAAVTAAAVIAIGGLAALATSLAHSGPQRQCVLNCPPPAAHAAGDTDFASPEERSFRGPAGFVLRYPTSWKPHAGTASFDTRDGGFFEVRTGTGADLARLVADRLRALNPQTFPDLKAIGPIRGAHIGGVGGVGTLYGGTMVPGAGGGSAERVRFAIIAARRGNLALVVTAGDWYDRSVTGSIPTGMPEAPEIDYALAQLRWPGS